MTNYFITFNSGKPEWNNHSKWFITAESRSEALHKANLMHDEVHGYDVNMITISVAGRVDLSEEDFVDLNDEASRQRLEVLDRIWQQKFNTLENC